MGMGLAAMDVLRQTSETLDNSNRPLLLLDDQWTDFQLSPKSFVVMGGYALLVVLAGCLAVNRWVSMRQDLASMPKYYVPIRQEDVSRGVYKWVHRELVRVLRVQQERLGPIEAEKGWVGWYRPMGVMTDKEMNDASISRKATAMESSKQRLKGHGQRLWRDLKLRYSTSPQKYQQRNRTGDEEEDTEEEEDQRTLNRRPLSIPLQTLSPSSNEQKQQSSVITTPSTVPTSPSSFVLSTHPLHLKRAILQSWQVLMTAVQAALRREAVARASRSFIPDVGSGSDTSTNDKNHEIQRRSDMGQESDADHLEEEEEEDEDEERERNRLLLNGPKPPWMSISQYMRTITHYFHLPDAVGTFLETVYRQARFTDHEIPTEVYRDYMACVAVVLKRVNGYPIVRLGALVLESGSSRGAEERLR